MDRRGKQGEEYLDTLPGDTQWKPGFAHTMPGQYVDHVWTGTFPNIRSKRISRVCLACIHRHLHLDTIPLHEVEVGRCRKTGALKDVEAR